MEIIRIPTIMRQTSQEHLKKGKTDVTFIPEISSMYPERFLTHIEVNEISGRLCGAFRPNHFRGVATVVTKLLNIVKPTRVYFGQKDFQQSVIIKQLVRDLNMGVDVVVC